MAQRMRVALITDTHTWHRDTPLIGEGGNVLLLDRAGELHATLLEEIRRAGVDMVIHLGDQTCGGGYFDMPASVFPAQLDDLHGDYTSLGVPLYCLPGNHDCPPGEGGWSQFEAIWQLGPGLGSTVDLGGARLVLLNTQGHDAAQIDAARPGDPIYGWVNDAELARVERDLEDAAGKPVVLALHQLLVPWAAPQPCPDYYLVRNTGAVLRLLQRHANVKAVFQGHAHFNELQGVPLDDRHVPFVIAPAVIEYPAAWLLLEFTATSLGVELRRLPLSESATRSMALGSSQQWRAGRPEWQRYALPL